MAVQDGINGVQGLELFGGVVQLVHLFSIEVHPVPGHAQPALLAVRSGTHRETLCRPSRKGSGLLSVLNWG